MWAQDLGIPLRRGACVKLRGLGLHVVSDSGRGRHSEDILPNLNLLSSIRSRTSINPRPLSPQTSKSSLTRALFAPDASESGAKVRVNSPDGGRFLSLFGTTSTTIKGMMMIISIIIITSISISNSIITIITIIIIIIISSSSSSIAAIPITITILKFGFRSM